MAMTEARNQDRPDPKSRRRPFSTWVKKLKNFKGGNSQEDCNGSSSKREKTLAKKRPSKNNNPYPESGRLGNNGPRHLPSAQSVSSSPSGVTSATSLARTASTSSATGGRGRVPTAGGRSMAATVSTMDHDAAHSIAAPSHGASSVAGTSRTAGGGLDSRRGCDSTFSSPAPSVRSLTTTLTTIQSMPMGPGNHHHNTHGQNSTSSHGHHAIHFNQPFPNTPASAIPAHLTPSSSAVGAAGQQGHPTTYNTATANGLLTDNASILTLASSSKRRRRRSLDTDASVRALAPSSLFGGSRESLPLSVLSATVDSIALPSSSSVPPVPSTPGGGAAAARSVAERASIYSVSGIGATDRSSWYAAKQQQQQQQQQQQHQQQQQQQPQQQQPAQSLPQPDKPPSIGGGGGLGGGSTDAASVRSGRLGHSRAESVNGSLGVSGALTSPQEDPRAEEEKTKTETETETETEVVVVKDDKGDADEKPSPVAH